MAVVSQFSLFKDGRKEKLESDTIASSVSNDEFNDRCNQIHAVKQVSPYQRIRRKKWRAGMSKL